jgi:uncharacterized membrane protein YfcA
MPTAILAYLGIGLLAGASGGLLGVGGGFLMVPLQMLLTKVRQVEANATSLAAVIPISIAGAIAYAPRVDVTFAILLMAGSVVGAYLGARFSARIPERGLQIIMAVVFAALGVKELILP